MQWDSAEVNGYSKRRSERNIQRKGSSAGGFVPSSYKDREEQLAREDAEIIKRVKALKDAPALVERAARHLDKEGTGPDYGGGRGLGTAGIASQAEDISKMTSQRKARSVYGDKEERLTRATREEGDGAHRKVDEKKIPGERNRAAETSAVRSTSIPAYLPPPAYPRRTLADEASEDDDELPMSTAPDSTPPAALSAVTVRRQASRERLRELRELSRAATDRVQGAIGKDQSAEAAFGELSWASFVSLVLWKNASKSTLVFGAGTFFILASSNMRDLQTSPLTIVANFLLLYTAFNFVLTFSRRHDPSPASTPVTEASVLAAVRVALPFLTATKAVHARLFNGDTTTTLQVALCLWVLALCGSVFTFWDVTRIAFFAAFLLPRVYLAYAHHIQAAGRSVYHRCRQLVLSFPHKRKLAAVCALGGWHWLSLPTKCFLGFVLLVLLRRYQEGHAQQVDAGVNFVKKQARRLSSTHPTTRKPAVRRATLEEID